MASKARGFYELIHSCPKGRWDGILRSYGAEDVEKLRGAIQRRFTWAEGGANRLWTLLEQRPYVNALGAVTGLQATQMVRAGLESIYLSGWQVAADANLAGATYPDQSLYPANSGPQLAWRINRALERVDQVEWSEGRRDREWMVPIVADAEAGFGGPLNCFEIMKAYVESGAAGVHFEDQLASEKKCGHMGGKVLLPTGAHIRNLNAARLAADVCGVGTLLIARTDAESATLITSDHDERDRPFIDHEAGRTPEGFFRLRKGKGLEHCVARAINYAPYSDLIWMETSTPNLEDARAFAEAVRSQVPNKMLSYNCSPSFNWAEKLEPSVIAKFQRELGAMGYTYQFVTLAGFHSLNYGMFRLSQAYKSEGMTAYSRLQQEEFDSASSGYTAVRHQHEAGTGYFDLVANAVAGGHSSTVALEDSTENAQFYSKSSFLKPKAPSSKIAARNYSTSSSSGLKLTMPMLVDDGRVISQGALDFVQKLEEKFGERRKTLLEKRMQRQEELERGQLPDFRPETADIRADPSWQILGVPDDLQNRQVEITGPVDRKMVINALNCGSQTYMADFEDSTTPIWRNQVDGQVNLFDAIRRKITFKDSSTGKVYRLGEKPGVLMIRPRGWHLPESHVLLNGQPISGSLFDFGIYFYNNAKTLLENKTGPYFYLPKLQSYEEAALWNDVFNEAQELMNIARGTIKATVLLEHILATFDAEEILYALKDHIIGLNCGRWDYIFSYIKIFRNDPTRVLPNRSLITMKVPFMSNYSKFAIKTCHKRGAHAMGGMAAQIPIKSDPAASQIAMDLVREDKLREVQNGHDGTWVAHPGLVPLASEIFKEYLGSAPNQVSKQLPDFEVSPEDLLRLPEGVKTEAGLRHNIDVTLGYLEAWLRGTGCVPLYNLMEDAATAEISRAQLWQWLQHSVQLEDGQKVTMEVVEGVIQEEKTKWLQQAGDDNRLEDAAQELSQLLREKDLPEFLTLGAYQRLVKEGH